MNMKLREAVMRNETMSCILCAVEILRECVIYRL